MSFPSLLHLFTRGPFNSKCFGSSEEDSNYGFHIVDQHLLEIQFEFIISSQQLIPHLEYNDFINFPVLAVVSKTNKRLWLFLLILGNPITILSFNFGQKLRFNGGINVLNICLFSLLLFFRAKRLSLHVVNSLNFLTSYSLSIFILLFHFALTGCSIPLLLKNRHC